MHNMPHTEAAKAKMSAARRGKPNPSRARVAELRSKALESIVLELAQDNIGIYPQSVQGGSKPYDKRTEWMEGWNACATAFSKYSLKIESWLHEHEYRQAIEDALLSDRIRLWVQDDGISMVVDCNDTFWWATADAEDIQPFQLGALDAAYAESPSHGGILWVARKRSMRPQGAIYRSIPAEQWPLFDACGPEREHDTSRLLPPAGDAKLPTQGEIE